MRHPLWLLPLLAACGESEEVPTYYGEAKAIVDSRCASCHQDGDIGPFPLTTFEEVKQFEGAVLASIESGSMPPWQPADDCNDYIGNIDLTEDEEATLVAWLEGGAPEGDAADFVEEEDTESEFVGTYDLPLPEAYTPELEPDDYRCQIIDWPGEETEYVTGIHVTPDQRAIVHHVIVFYAGPEEAERYRAFDEAEEGPGYTCYGGPTGDAEIDREQPEVDYEALMEVLEELGLSLADLQAGNLTPAEMAAVMEALGLDVSGGFSILGTWVPGTPQLPLPEGTGIRVEPGSVLIAQMHYNTQSAEPVADRTTLSFSVTDSVEQEGTNLQVTDLGWVMGAPFGDEMAIPAGESEVSYDTTMAGDSMMVQLARARLGLSSDDALTLYSAAHHMHELGTSQRSEVRRADGTTECLLDLPDWDFNWQGAYQFVEPVTLEPEDAVWMGCTWDNSAANQPVIDGEVREPADVSWGEGTSDEMCLGGLYVTAAR